MTSVVTPDIEAPVVESMEEIFSTNDFVYQVIDAWGKRVRIVSLTADDFIEWQEANDGPAKKNAGIRLFVRSIVNSKNEHIGSDKDIEKLKQKSLKEVLIVINKILKLNGLTEEKNTNEVERQKNA